MSSTNYAERMAIRNASTLAQAPANYASFLIENIALAVQDINDPRDRLANQVGRLQGVVRQLCAQLEAEQPQGEEVQPEDGPDLFDEEPIRDDRFADCAAADWLAGRTS